MTQGLKIGVVALARQTFDVPYARRIAAAAWRCLQRPDIEVAGSAELLFEADGVQRAIETFKTADLDLVLVLQVTFADAAMTVEIAGATPAPLLLWSFPEPRSGERLRLNSVCGINLAAHALGKAGRDYDYIHGNPDDPKAIETILHLARAGRCKRRLNGARIGLIGRHPDGFDTCAYDPQALARLCGATVDFSELDGLFARAGKVPDEVVDAVYQEVQADLGNLEKLEQAPLRQSLRIYCALKDLAKEKRYAGIAMRCWPEIFTEFGCAACGPMAMLNEQMLPCACEADVYGVVSSLMLQHLCNAQVFMTDMVDFSPAQDNAVLWHCGLAPLSMADPEGPVRATIHSNRKLPLLNEFALKPGRITLARISQSQNRVQLVVGGGEVIRAPLSFSGTSGVVRFDRPVARVLDTVMREGLEHHICLCYGDVRPELTRLARMLALPVLSLT